ncbi:PHD finger protein 7 [Eumeta japonica]|uniref:PHD finger protein 7 n=1 Tax=Eumeta variegata TaxID=151549 RepID=A0A4C1T2K5_EUMVA|nr:PHD finger protein 7 [Eumeta japonica]
MDVCILCKSSKKNDIQYGEFLKNKNFGVHTFCLYLSSNLLQNGADDEGFLGFLPKDIKTEVRRISFLGVVKQNAGAPFTLSVAWKIKPKIDSVKIFAPTATDMDAAWELEPNAFAELLERPNECAAVQCNNRKGRKAVSDVDPFVMCRTCGSIAIHKYCLPKGDRNFNCTDCSGAWEEHDSGRESLNSHGNQNDDEYIDVCHVSDKEDFDLINRFIATSSKRTDNKRDSGTNNDSDDISDEETHHTTNIYRQTKSSEKKSNLDYDTDDIKPHTSKRSSRLRIDSESSEAELRIRRSCNKPRYISETDSSSSDQIMSEKN